MTAPSMPKHAVVTVGSWAAKLLGDAIALPTITVTQEQPRLFEPRDPSQEWPCFVHWRNDGGEFGHYESYGLFEAGAGIKVGLHASGPAIDPDHRDFLPEPVRDEVLHQYVRDWFPGLDPERSAAISCLYDNTDNGDFVIDSIRADDGGDRLQRRGLQVRTRSSASFCATWLLVSRSRRRCSRSPDTGRAQRALSSARRTGPPDGSGRRRPRDSHERQPSRR